MGASGIMSGVGLRRRIRGRIGVWGRAVGVGLHDVPLHHDKLGIMSATFQIRRPQVADDIRALSELMKVSMTDAVEAAVREKLESETKRREAARAENWREAQQIVKEFRKLPIVGPRLTDADLYDEDGMPKSFDI